jgi:ornithine cyclodeaminase/alanine dehydrogenase-like protein (mu-crystallin family)
VRDCTRIYAYDREASRAAAFATALASEFAIDITAVEDLAQAVAASEIVITCTTAQRYFITREMVGAGTFVAGVGADNENKQELDPRLLAASTLVADLVGQCCAIGDLHHAIEAGVMARADVHAELGEVITGSKHGRRGDDEIIVFDSTGTALQDVAAAVAVYQSAIAHEESAVFSFNA